MTRVLVTGSRDWHDALLIVQVLSQYGPDTVLIHGAARGADTHAAAYGRSRQWTVYAEPARWDLFGRAAGPVRNQRMLTQYQPDVCHAFHDDLEHSKGTRDMVDRCRAAGVPVHIHRHVTDPMPAGT